MIYFYRNGKLVWECEVNGTDEITRNAFQIMGASPLKFDHASEHHNGKLCRLYYHYEGNIFAHNVILNITTLFPV